MSTPPVSQSNSSTRSRLRTNTNNFSGSRTLHRTPTGRIARARSTSALNFSDINRRAIWEAAVDVAYRSNPSGPLSDSGVYPSVSAVSDCSSLYLPVDATPSSVQVSPRPAYSEPLPSVAEEAPPVDDLFVEYFPALDEPHDFGSMDVMMSSQYGNYGSYASYPSNYSTSYAGSEHQQPTVTSSPAPSYPSYVSSPQSSHTSHATAQTSGPPRASQLLTPHYQTAPHGHYESPAASQQPSYPGYGSTSHMQPTYAGAYAGSSGSYDANYAAYQGQAPSNYAQSSYPYAEGSQQSIALAGGIAGGSRVVSADKKAQCWEHGCNGREFSTFSNLLRHQREKSGTAAKSECPYCGAKFTRTTARNGHMAHDKCKGKRKSSGRSSDAE